MAERTRAAVAMEMIMMLGTVTKAKNKQTNDKLTICSEVAH